MSPPRINKCVQYLLYRSLSSPFVFIIVTSTRIIDYIEVKGNINAMISYRGTTTLISIIVLLATLARGATPAPTHHPESPWCTPYQQGCSSAATCECVWLFTYCNMDSVPAGTCDITKYGYVAIILSALVAAAFLAIVIGCCWCCCCRRCCKPSHEPGRHETHFHFPHAHQGAGADPYTSSYSNGLYGGGNRPQQFTAYDNL